MPILRLHDFALQRALRPLFLRHRGRRFSVPQRRDMEILRPAEPKLVVGTLSDADHCVRMRAAARRMRAAARGVARGVANVVDNRSLVVVVALLPVRIAPL